MNSKQNSDGEGTLPTSILNQNASFHTCSNLPNQILEWIDEEGYDLLSITNLQGELLLVSSNVKKVLGFQREELIGKNILDFFIREDRVNFKKQFNVSLRESAQIHTYRFKHKMGKYVWVESKIKRIQYGNENIECYVALTRDITDKKEAEEIFVRSEKMSVAGQLAAGIAHEIRNPITSLKGFLQLLQTGIEGKAEYYRIMEEEIEKIQTITSELLFISKPLTNEIQNESIAELLNDICTLLNSQARLYDITINLNIDIDISINCDRSQIKQVFINIIKNAIEVMEDGGIIEVKVCDKHPYVVIDVIDEGTGIPDEIIDKINEPFFTTKKNGTGLGLMITNQILEKHHGKLEVYQNETVGSTFRVLLPKS